jgi:catechol 2,3-dioxygenase-like lactoylglutathione lyase family enzyme
MEFASNGDFAIHVRDLARARTFYRDTLGFKLLQHSGEKLVFATGNFTLYVNKDGKNIPFIPALKVPDYEAAKRFLESAGCKIIREWPGSGAFYFRDPLGQVMDIIQS